MKIAVIGSRSFTNFRALADELGKYDITEIISGGARGADSLAEKYAKEHDIPVNVIKPDWIKFGRGAGMIRNTDIIKSADFVIAFWDGKSPGTKDSINKTKKAGKPYVIISV